MRPIVATNDCKPIGWSKTSTMLEVAVQWACAAACAVFQECVLYAGKLSQCYSWLIEYTHDSMRLVCQFAH
jgi:hypothetical protein